MSTEEYRLTKIQLACTDMPIQESGLHLKVYTVVFLVTFALFFFAIFAVFIAAGLAIIFSLILFFRQLAKKRKVRHINQ